MAYAIIDSGVVINAVEASAEFASEQGWVELPEGVGIGWAWDGSAFTPPTPPTPVEPTSANVDTERDRRIAAGFTFGGKHYQSRPEDRENIAGASLAALAAMSGAFSGDYRWHGGNCDFVWIAADNSLTPMDAQTMFAFGQAAMAHNQAHIFAGRALKDAVPIRADYADDSHWPF